MIKQDKIRRVLIWRSPLALASIDWLVSSLPVTLPVVNRKCTVIWKVLCKMLRDTYILEFYILVHLKFHLGHVILWIWILYFLSWKTLVYSLDFDFPVFLKNVYQNVSRFYISHVIHCLSNAGIDINCSTQKLQPTWMECNEWLTSRYQ